MPGRLDSNLRRGNLAEKDGVALLRLLCAVAEVPREEDVGVDAIATILQPEGRFLYADHSFAVQIKSRSQREITYDRAAYAWLRSFELPLFLGSVNLPTDEIALYATHNATCHADADRYESLVIQLDRPSNPPAPLREVFRVWLGDPILVWKRTDLQSPEFSTRVRSILSQWVQLEQRHKPLRAIRTMELVKWGTNEPPTSDGTLILGDTGDLTQDVQAATPYLMKLGAHFLTEKEPTAESMAFLTLLLWLEKQGVDEFRQMAKVFVSHLTSSNQTVSLNLEIRK